MSALKTLLKENDSRIQGILMLLVQTAIDTLNADEGSLLVPTDDGRNLEFVATISPDNRDLSAALVKIGEGITGMAAMVRDVQIGSKASTGLNNVKGDGDPESIIAAPLLVDDELLGVMTVVRLHNKTPFTPLEAKRFLRLSTVGAVVIDQQKHLTGPWRTTPDFPPGSAADDICQTFTSLIKRLPPSRLQHLRQLIASIDQLSSGK